ncbi:uncharacterized protein LOC143284600 [Babylonia areolata]|uniref:uncharacterized protein LOC143284600 n=1 Tax=Babylonia areolata TaxID=304850 RepID=UPI003FD69F1C
MTLVFIFVVVITGFVSMGVTALNLTCYSCNTTNENDVCYSNVSAAPTEVCDPTASSMSCSVYREDVAGRFTFIQRACNTSCVQVCGAWGEEVDIDKCSSCCSSHLCNVDDAAATLPRATTMTMAVTCLPLLLLWAALVEGSVVSRGGVWVEGWGAS